MSLHRVRGAAVLAVVLVAGGCAGAGPSHQPDAQASPSPTTAAATPQRGPLDLADTGIEPFEVTDFEAVHGPTHADGTGTPIFGALPIAAAGPDVPPATAAFLGRWEGYGLGLPIRRDWKYVLAVTEIGASDGTAYLWAGTNVQFPAGAARVHFRVTGSGPATTIEWAQPVNGADAVVSIRNDAATGTLEGGSSSVDPAGRLTDVVFRRDTAELVVFEDYERHLADLGIAWVPHTNPGLAAVGAGSLVYLPPGYADDPDRAWPLILFFHGSGDRGHNGLILAQNSPFRFVTEGNRPDAVIVAPLLAPEQSAFPTTYLDDILDAALETWRVDPDRVTLTGLSMGGEAVYRLARHRPESIAGIAVLCGFEARTFPTAVVWGYPRIPEPPTALAGMPVRVIHGRDDRTVPVWAAQAAVDDLSAAGAYVEFTVLDDHDHDVWTDTYSDPAIFDWLLGQRVSARR